MPDKKPVDYAFYTLIFFILFFLAAYLSSQIILRGELIFLPDLKGKSLEEARAELAVKRTSIAMLSRQFDTRIEKDRIISQDPGAGSRVKTNRTVNVIVSEGSERVPVPRLEGRSLEFASQILKSAGLRKGRVAQIHTPRYAAGRIIAQQPPAEDVVGRNAPVDFLVSQGAWEARYIMPDLIEKNAAAVIRRLKALEFQVAEIHYSYYPGLGPGVIIKQAPVAGTRILRRNQITLEVSK
ncbi:MAG: PASTA domain-containing protein [Candidatus Aminicenantes bacterium]|nr:PASTA domain-containing protein [Candidatus Aminicenantes bacterium]